MALQAIYTNEQYHQLFYKYLMDRFDGESEEVNAVIQTAEEVLPFTLGEYFGTSFSCIYELQDENEIEALRKKIKAHNVLKNLDRREEPRYTEVLKWYRLFVKSLHNEATPLQVPGEQKPEDEEDEDFHGVHDDPEERATRFTTIFLEGEAAMQQPKEIRLRNQHLRDACKAHFRMLHKGRLVCECCGFDFEKAYGKIGEDYIEIHHRFPFSQTEGEHPVDAITDLVPLCSNCHSMIHRAAKGQGTCISLEDLQRIYKGIKYDND